MSDGDLRDRINFSRLLLIIGLVFLHYGEFPGSDHSPFRGMSLTDAPIATFVNGFFLFLFFSAVPLLSAVSGFLFFKDMENSWSFYRKRYLSRTRSVLFPMVTWDAIVLGLFLAILIVSPSSPFLSIISYDLSDLNPLRLLNALVGVTRHPINFQFWFLRDLFLTILLTPLIGLLIRVAPFFGLAAIGAVWLAGYDLGIFFRTDVLFFFYVGSLFRLRRWNLDFVSPKVAVTLMIVYVVMTGLRTVAPALVSEDSLVGDLLFEPGTRALRVLGVIAFWGCAPLLMRTFVGRRITAYGTLAFFLHAIHWPLNQFIKAGLAGVIPGGGQAAQLANYFGTIALTLVAAFLAARVLGALAPKLFSHLSGGRLPIWSLKRTEQLPASRSVGAHASQQLTCETAPTHWKGAKESDPTQ